MLVAPHNVNVKAVVPTIKSFFPIMDITDNDRLSTGVLRCTIGDR